MAGALDMARADRQRRKIATETRRALEKQSAGAPQNKMLPGPPANKGNPAKIAPSAKPALAGVTFASAPARAQAEEAGLGSADFPEDVRRKGVAARDVRQALERRAAR